MICGHGSREAGTVHEFAALVRDVAVRVPQYRMESGFLEYAAPTIQDGLEKLRRAGCARILVIPGTLFSAGHAQQDIPSILRNFVADFPDVQISYGRAFDVDTNFVRAACGRVRDAIEAAPGVIAPEETALLVAARGASDADVLATMEAVARLIQDDIKLANVQTAYAGIALPRVPDVLEQIAACSYKRVILLPYFLFTGMLVKRIYEQVDSIAARYPATQFVKTSYLSNHPLVIDSFMARIDETDRAGTVMNG